GGLDAGDEIVGIGGARVEGGNVDATLRGRTPGDAVDVLLARYGRLLSRRVTLDAPRPDKMKIVANRDAAPLARAAFTSWLGRPHPAWDARKEAP
ncbi:MAG: hypothetical protein ACRELB_14000, partial [Polyangiaceae bacterium]